MRKNSRQNLTILKILSALLPNIKINKISMKKLKLNEKINNQYFIMTLN